MRSLLLVLTLALGLVACSGKGSSTTPRPTGPITAEAMKTYFAARLPDAVKDGTITIDFGGPAEDVLRELSLMGITDMRALAALVPADFQTKGIAAIKGASTPTESLTGLTRDLMIIHDARGYFTKAWNNGWSASGPDDFAAPMAYGVDLQLLQELGVFGGSDDVCGGGDWEGGGDMGDEDVGDEDPCGE